MSKTRCKFVVQEIKRTQYNGSVILAAQYDTKINNEDSAFNTATPNGKLEMTLYPVDKVDFFIPGKSYYIDISPVEGEVKSATLMGNTNI